MHCIAGTLIAYLEQRMESGIISLDQRIGCKGATLLHYLTRLKHFLPRQESVENFFIRFLAKGADPLAQDELGVSPLELALPDFDLVAMYLDTICNRCKKNSEDKNNVLVDWVDSQGRTLLHYMALSGSEEQAQYLLDKGCDLLRANNSGKTPLQAKHFSDHGNIIRFFMAFLIGQCKTNKMCVNQIIDNEQRRLIHYALNYASIRPYNSKNFEVAIAHVKELLTLGADVTVQDISGLSADTMDCPSGELYENNINEIIREASAIQRGNQSFIGKIAESIRDSQPFNNDSQRKLLESLSHYVQTYFTLKHQDIINKWISDLNLEGTQAPFAILAGSQPDNITAQTKSLKLFGPASKNLKSVSLLPLLEAYAGKDLIDCLVANEKAEQERSNHCKKEGEGTELTGIKKVSQNY